MQCRSTWAILGSGSERVCAAPKGGPRTAGAASVAMGQPPGELRAVVGDAAEGV